MGKILALFLAPLLGFEATGYRNGSGSVRDLREIRNLKEAVFDDLQLLLCSHIETVAKRESIASIAELILSTRKESTYPFFVTTA